MPRREIAIVCRIGMAALLLLVVGNWNPTVRADEPDGQTYLLRYHLQAGEKIHYEVTHVAKTKTRIRGVEEISNVHTVSQRHWNITDLDQNIATFDHVLDTVHLTQQQGSAEEIRWDSQGDEPPPVNFERLAEQVGDIISTISVDPRGREIDREKNVGTKSQLGMGSLTIAFPEDPIAVGDSWSIPREVKVKDDEGFPKTIEIRELYTLKKVKTGVATLTVRSEPLTPIRSEGVRSQVLQQLSNGEIRFDIDNGRMLSKQLDWDENVVGFQGANSMMEYRAQLTERLIDGVQRTARRP